MISHSTVNCSNTNCCFMVSVLDVTHAGFAYDAGVNVQSTGAANCNVFAPPACGAAASACPADFNGDGLVSGEDLLALLDAMHDGGAPAPPGSTVAQGVMDFLAAFVEGCPSLP